MNPSNKSPASMFHDHDYEVMGDYIPNEYWPSASEMIVKHKQSNTFWRAVYAIREDDSDAELPATWVQVVPEIVTVTKYKTIS